MINPKDLIFFNKEGFPYNFSYNDTSEKWEGKLIFDENSSDLYKTIGLYTFENVDTITFNDDIKFNRFEIFNNSGISFVSKTIDNYILDDITTVNDANNFYSKWIYGNDIDRKFPVGTIISLSGVNSTDGYSSNEFDSSIYFTIQRTQKNAILICTKTNNKLFNDTYTINFNNPTISSHNIIDITEYKQELDTDFNKLYNGKKLTILNSTLNNGIYTYENSAKTYSTVYDYILSGNSTQFLELEIELFTERPLLYEGNVNISGSSYSGITINFENKLRSYFKVGDGIIFESTSGYPITGIEDNQYEIDQIIDKNYISSSSLSFYRSNDVNYIILTGSSSLIEGDRMYLSGITTSHSDRIFRILYIESNYNITTYIVDQSVNYETGFTYQIYKMIPTWEQDTIIVHEIGFNTNNFYDGYALCYLDTNILKYSQQILTSGSSISYLNTIESFNKRFRTLLNMNGIDTYYLSGNSDYFIVEGLYDFDYNNNPYFSATARIKNNNDVTIYTLSTGGTLNQSGTISENYYIEVTEQLKNERVYLYDKDKLTKNYYTEIEFNLTDDISGFGLNVITDNIDHYVTFDIDTETTISNFITKYFDVFYNIGFEISQNNNILIISGLYPDVRIYELLCKVNGFSSYDIIKEEYSQIITLAGNELKSTTINFLDLGLTSGMIIDISGSSYISNNRFYNILDLTGDTIQLSYQGLFFEDTSYSSISSREYLRKPRGTVGRDIWLKFEWNLQTNDIFYYDVTGNHLEPYNDIESLTYTGVKPLFDTGNCNDNGVFLNKEPNQILDYINDPKKQQTIFDNLTFKLERYEDSSISNFLPDPLQVFIGFNSKVEGVSQSILSIKEIENVIFSGVTNDESSPYDYFTTIDNELKYWTNNTFNFSDYGFYPGQLISLQFYDTSTTGQTVFKNYDNYELIDVTPYKLKFNTTFEYFNSSGKTYDFIIKTVPKEIAIISIFGETEIEDVRLDSHLKILGIHITHEEEKIFKESDIQEFGIDYKLLNKKRKEMLANFTEIYNYISSYKSMINAINYFGYNDLQVYEYYRNINLNSPLYGKIFRTHIPDMFDLSTEGWNELDQIKDNDLTNFIKTNLFNLTYRITDEDGNNINQYSLEEVQIKLKSLVKWLERNIIPLSANIKDITGVSDTKNILYQVYDDSNRVQKMVTLENTSVINYSIYSTLNFGTNYLIVLDFYTNNNIIPDSFTVRIKTFRKENDRLYPVQYYNLLKTDMKPFRFNADSQIDPYIYIEIIYYNDNGIGMCNNQLQKFDERKNYMLVNNNFLYTYVPYIQTNSGTNTNPTQNVTIDNSDFYLIDEQNNFWILSKKFLNDYWNNSI